MQNHLFKLKRLAIALTLFAGILANVSGSVACSQKMESISVAYAPYMETAFYWIAQDQHFFSQNRLDVTFREYDALIPAIDAMLKGEVDIVGNVTEFRVVYGAFQKTRISTIASITKSNTINLIGRKDCGIEHVSDLKGKRVGTVPGTITDFYLGRLLELNGMNLKDITFVDIKTPAESVKAVVNGDTDAVVVGQPYANSAREQLGANAFFQSAQSNQHLYALAVSTDEWITNQPELVRRFLKSLSQAEKFLVQHPAEAKAIIRKRLNYDEAYSNSVWPQYTFSLSLDQSLIVAMEDEARWLMDNNLTTEKTMPDILDYIYLDGLKAVKPEAVNITK